MRDMIVMEERWEGGMRWFSESTGWMVLVF